MDKWTRETWLDATLVETYEDSENVTLPAAKALIDQSGILESSDKALTVLDLGSGMGQVVETLLADSRVSGEWNVVCGDIDDGLLQKVESKRAKHGWSNVEVVKMDATKMSNVKDDTFDNVIGNFLYFLTSDPIAALRETHRVLRPDGTISFTTWGLSGPFALLQLAQAHMVDYPLAPPNSRLTGHWNHPRYVSSQLESVGYTDIKITSFPFVQKADSARDMAKKMRHAIMLHTLAWGTERQEKGWELGQMIEKVLQDQRGPGPIEIHSVALLITAKKT